MASQPAARLAPADIARAEDVVRSAGWLSRTSPEFRDAILANVHWARFDAGASITHAGDAGGLRAIAEGQATVLPAMEGPSHGVIHIAQAPFWFGAVPLISGEGRVASVTARIPCIVATVPHDQVSRLLTQEPAWWRYIALHIHELFAVTLQALCDAYIRNGEARCAAVLLRLSQWPAHTGMPAPIACTQAELAAMCAMSRQSLVAVLDQLESQRLIERGYRSITVRDVEALRAFVAAADD
jgi:CRP-like cAMP-binding protein